MLLIFKKVSLSVLLGVVAGFTFSGCATIGVAGAGLVNGFMGITEVILGVLNWFADIASKLPSF